MPSFAPAPLRAASQCDRVMMFLNADSIVTPSRSRKAGIRKIIFFWLWLTNSNQQGVTKDN